MLPVGEKGSVWRNWSGIVQTQPRTTVYPDSVEAVVDLVRGCNEQGRRLRVVGSGHSFTPLAATDDVLVSLDRLSGVLEVDMNAQTATVWAGTKLRDLGEALFEHGLAQENLGDINVQSVAGAISTGTHGTGCAFGTLSTQVIGLTAVLGSGELVECSPNHQPDLFRALQVSLGALGILVKVKLRLTPAFKMVYESRRMALDECLERLDEFKSEYRHFEFYCFPYSDQVQVKLMNQTDESVSSGGFRDFFGKVVMENWAFGALSSFCRAAPSLCRPTSRFSATNAPTAREVGYSHRLFATPRLVRFNEMEYNLPAQDMPVVIREVLAAIERDRIAVHFPIECRFAKRDEMWLSPAYGRDSAYIAVHMYKGMPHEAYFRTMESIFLNHQGRPHWGKLHFLQAEQLHERYPMWDPFLAIRKAADPNGVLLNPYLRSLFGVEEETVQ